MSKKTFALILIVILALMGSFYYWFFVRNNPVSINTISGTTNSGNGIFGTSGKGGSAGINGNGNLSSTTASTVASSTIPALRELSATPVGGMISSTTASTTIVRWIDRGTGHIYQAYADNTSIDELSDTTVPMIYESYWDTAADSFIFNSLTDDSDAVTTFYAKMFATASTSSSTTPYSLSGTPLSNETLAIAVSPAVGKKGNQVFTLVGNGNAGATGYVSNFDGTKKTQIFQTPLEQLNVEWPAANTIAITTKASASDIGFLYFVNPKNGTFNKIIGNMAGLSTLVNSDASEVLYSRVNNAGNGITTSVYNTTTGQSQDLPFGTLPEKCVWSTIQENILYCAIPSTIPSASYPDAWYQGTVSFTDTIWEIDTSTGDVHELVDLLKTSGQHIDAENLQLSPGEDFIYFMNKDDLSLWSFDLNAI